MEIVFTFLASCVIAVLSVIEIAMLLRMVCSFLFPEGEGAFFLLILAVTEPVIIPFRLLFHRLNWFQNVPLDVAFFAAALTVSMISTALSLAV